MIGSLPSFARLARFPDPACLLAAARRLAGMAISSTSLSTSEPARPLSLPLSLTEFWMMN